MAYKPCQPPGQDLGHHLPFTKFSKKYFPTFFFNFLNVVTLRRHCPQGWPLKMTPYFEKINTICLDSSFDLKTVPAPGPGPEPPFTIFKNFQNFFWKMFACFTVFDQNSPRWPSYVFRAEKVSFFLLIVVISFSYVFVHFVWQLKGWV